MRHQQAKHEAKRAKAETQRLAQVAAEGAARFAADPHRGDRGAGGLDRVAAAGMKLIFEPRDLWVGVYLGSEHIYVCPLPCIVLRFPRKDKR